MRKTQISTLIVALIVVLFSGFGAVQASSIPIANGTFELPLLSSLPGNPTFATGIPSWTLGGLGSGGVFSNASYISSAPGTDPDGGAQGGFINIGSTMFQQIGTVTDHASYTVNFYTATDDGVHTDVTTVALYAGTTSPTTLLGSQPFTGTTGHYTGNNWTLPLGVTGVGGEHLFLQFSNDGTTGNAFVDAVTVTATPEPSSLILCGLGAVGLLLAARRHRKA